MYISVFYVTFDRRVILMLAFNYVKHYYCMFVIDLIINVFSVTQFLEVQIRFLHP